MLDRKSNSNSRNTAPEPSQEAQEQSLYAPVAPTPEEQWNKHVTRVMRRRTNSMVAIFVCLAIISILGVVWIKGGPRSEELSAKAQQYSFREEIVEASRGDILSDDYRVLTTSISYYELRMDLNAAGLTDTLFNGNVEQLSVQLSEFLGDSTAQVYHDRLVEARKRRNGYFRLSFKKVNYLELREIRKFALLNLPPNVGGFIPQEMERRVNPYGALASRTIGFINRNGVKVGIEGSFDEYLRGSNGAMVKQKVSGSFWIPVNSPFNIEPVNGANVVTTLDIDIQDIAQRALIQQVDEVRADWGCAIVMEVATGEIKAMANITRESSGEMYEDYNYAIGMSLDPGSTFKLPVMMALLEDGGFSLSSMVDAGSGREQVGYATVRDTRSGGYGRQSLLGVFEHSSNIGMAKLVTQTYQNNPSRFVNYIRQLGLGERLGVSINGESEPIIKEPGKRGWDGLTITMMSYGYALRLAPIHTLAIYNAVANGGTLLRPLLVKEIVQDGVKIKEFAPDTIKSNIASEKTLEDAHHALVSVVENGTAKTLKSDRYGVAAKTGTAQIAMGSSGYSSSSGDTHYLGSIAGYFPAEDPKYSIIVALKTFKRYGENKPYYGVALAGAPFKSIMEQVFNRDLEMRSHQQYESEDRSQPLVVSRGSSEKLDGLKRNLSIARVTQKEYGALSPWQQRRFDSLGIADLRGYALNDALPILYAKGFKVDIVGRGEIDDVDVVTDSLGQRVVLILR